MSPLFASMGTTALRLACAILTTLHIESIRDTVCAMIFYGVMLCAGAQLTWVPSLGIIERCRVPL
jgi:hypothetical protein